MLQHLRIQEPKDSAERKKMLKNQNNYSTDNYFRLPDQVSGRFKDMPGNLIPLYFALLSHVEKTGCHDGYCNLSINAIAKKMDKSKNTILKALNLFEKYDIGRYKNGVLYIRTVDNDGTYPEWSN